jgi:hypothetical protein
MALKLALDHSSITRGPSNQRWEETGGFQWEVSPSKASMVIDVKTLLSK